MGTWEGNGPRLGASVGTHALMHRVCIPMHDNGSLMRLHGLGLSKAPPGTGDEISLERIHVRRIHTYMTGSQLISDSGIKCSADSENRRTPPLKRTYTLEALCAVTWRNHKERKGARCTDFESGMGHGVTGYDVQACYVCNAQVSLPVQAIDTPAKSGHGKRLYVNM